jgi:hypothetical protein
MGYHGKPWDFMVIALFTKGNHKISWGIPWKTMGHPSNAMDVMGLHGGFPWCPIKCHGHHGTSWGLPLAPREIIKFHGVSHGALQQVMGNPQPQYAMEIIWDAMGITIVAMGNPINPWGVKWKT